MGRRCGPVLGAHAARRRAWSRSVRSAGGPRRRTRHAGSWRSRLGMICLIPRRRLPAAAGVRRTARAGRPRRGAGDGSHGCQPRSRSGEGRKVSAFYLQDLALSRTGTTKPWSFAFAPRRRARGASRSSGSARASQSPSRSASVSSPPQPAETVNAQPTSGSVEPPHYDPEGGVHEHSGAAPDDGHQNPPIT